MTWSGDFKHDGSDETAAVHDPQNEYYLGCVSCGANLDRTKPVEEHRQPALIKQRKWSYRISQLSIAAIDLSQIVARFQSAVADPEEMVVFRCDVLALPQSTSQALTPAILDRARSIEVFDLAPRVRPGNAAFGGLDMGDRCWLFAREVAGTVAAVCDHRPSTVGTVAAVCDRRPSTPTTMPLGWIPLPGANATSGSVGHDVRSAGARETTPHVVACNRLLSAHKIPAADVVTQAQAHFHRLGLSALFIDERPLVNEARAIALALNGLQSLTQWPRINDLNSDYVTLPGGLTWDGKNSRWYNLKCAVVRFTKTKLGAGIEQTVVFFEEGGQTKFVPCIACNRYETMDRVVREFLTPAEGVSNVMNGKIRETPAMLLPRMVPGHPPILDTVESHLITGSEREKEAGGSLGDYVDGCENHFLLANAYSALAATLCSAGQKPPPAGPIWVFENTRQSRAVAMRQDRTVWG